MSNSTITFTAYSDAGVSLGTTKVSGIVLYDTDHFEKAMNQSEGFTLDGGSIVEGNLVTRKHGVLIMAAVSLTEGRNFRTFLKSPLNFKGNYLGIAITAGDDFDLGKGVGDAIVFADGARYASKDTKATSKMSAPGLFSIRLKYTLKG